MSTVSVMSKDQFFDTLLDRVELKPSPNDCTFFAGLLDEAFSVLYDAVASDAEAENKVRALENALEQLCDPESWEAYRNFDEALVALLVAQHQNAFYAAFTGWSAFMPNLPEAPAEKRRFLELASPAARNVFFELEVARADEFRKQQDAIATIAQKARGAFKELLNV